MKRRTVWKIFLIILFIIIPLLNSQKSAFSFPQADFTLYGNASVGNMTLTSSDIDCVITLEVNEDELVKYKMGSLPKYKDYYVLKVPMDSNPSVSGKAFAGDSAYIFINGQPINENPVSIGNPGKSFLLNISIP